MRLASPFTAAALLLATVACNSNESVAALAKSSAQLAESLPRVAAVPYNACVDQRIMQQIDNSSADLPDRNAAEKACRLQAVERDRIAKLYGVLTIYLDVLGKLATGKTQNSEQSIKSAVSTAAGLNGADSGNQAAISGLAGAIAAAYLHTRTVTKLREAITAADPHVQALSKAFSESVAPGMMQNLHTEEQQLQTLFTDTASSGPVRVLLVRQFDSDRSRISENRDLVNNYAAALTKLALAHAALYANRNRLSSREVVPELLAHSDAVAQSLKALGK